MNNLKKIYSKNEIPQNMSEDEAADFWSTHAMSEELLEDSILEEEILRDLVAQGLSGQDLVKEFEKVRAKLRQAVERMLEEADQLARKTNCSGDEKMEDLLGYKEEPEKTD